MPAEPTFEDIQRAAAQIRGLIHRTPVMTSRLFNEAAGVSCFFKCENLQRGGAFKMRGAAYFVSSLPESERRRGVVTYSSGNHGQAVAIAAEHFGVPATVVMPEDAPKAKIDSTRAHGATIVTYDRSREIREEIGQAIAKERGASIVPPYDHPWTITGQGTAAMELLDDVPDLDAVLVCLGGGGLLAGSAIAARGMKPSIEVFGVEPEIANDWALSLKANERVEIAQPPTIADGLRTQKPGAVTFPIVQRLATGVLLVSEDEIRATIRFLLTRTKLVVEPSGAVAAAAALHKKLRKDFERVGIVITGGNIDMEMLSSICGSPTGSFVD
ncbi:MAG TPA: pyridoxal-phosphate dependent enzyme [Bryobacteraceae bacterium]|nr:pyridoxal-phosphate dependent enzyme [Bryobacteraceae bacterium]